MGEVHWKYDDRKSRLYKLACATKTECALCLHPIFDKRHGKRKHNARKAHYINKDSQYKFYLHKKVIFGPKQCICSTCYALPDADKAISDDAIEEIQIETHSFINRLLDSHDIYHRKKQNKDKKMNHKQLLRLDKLTNEQTKLVCGYNKDQMNSIVDTIKTQNDIMINILHLFIALTVWYNNLGYRFAAVLFGYKYESSVCYAIEKVINQMTFYWVPKWIGYPYWTAAKILNTVPQFVTDLYHDEKILGCIDATYLYKEHSNTNFQYQKVTYSMHKNSNLQKEHVWCTTDGKVVLVDGPHRADTGDGVIWDSIIHDANHEIYDIMGTTDDNECEYSIAADRGYTQVNTLARAPELLTTLGVKTNPSAKRGDPKQLTREQADSSRHVPFLS